jgi:hypothetical protein
VDGAIRGGPHSAEDLRWSSQGKLATATLGQADDGAYDQSYVVELALPWSTLAAGEETSPEVETPWP